MKKSWPYIALLFALGFSLFCDFSYLGWGAPSLRRDLQVFGSLEEMQKRVPKMIEQRKKYYDLMTKMLDNNEPFKEAYLAQLHRWDTKNWEEMPGELVLDRMRNYVIGMNISDEQITMSAISGLNPKNLDFTPGSLGYYGGLYYYTAGAFLVFGKIMGWVTLSRGVEYYFTHPEEIRRMYALVRAVNGVSIFLTILVLFSMMAGLYSYPVAALTALFYAAMPLAVPFSHLAKAHFFATFWLVLGLYFCARMLRSEEESESYAHAKYAGIFLGLSAGAIITNLLALPLIFFAECLRRDWDLKSALRSKFFWVPSLLFISVYCATNFYIFFRLPEYLRLIQGMVTYFTPYVEVQWHAWPGYLKEFMLDHVNPLILPLAALGIYQGLKSNDKFIRLCLIALAIFFLHNLFTMRHAPVNSRFLPILAFLAAWGSIQVAERLKSEAKVILQIYIFLAVAFSVLQCDYYRRWHRDPSNLDLAGDWINQNIPKGSTVGAWGGGLAPQDFPPIQFLNYKMISVPHSNNLEAALTDKTKIPDYIVLNSVYEKGNPKSVLLTSRYATAASWEPPAAYLGIPFPASWCKTGNWGVKVLKKIS